MKAETPSDTVRDVQANAAANTLADRLTEVKAIKVSEIIDEYERRISTLNVFRIAGKGRRQDGCQDTERP